MKVGFCDLTFFLIVFHSCQLKQSVCKQCSKGQFATASGTVLCQDCLPGTRGNALGMKNCINCDAGMYRDGSSTDLTKCKQCGLGEFQGQDGKTFCSSCDAGMYQDEVSFGTFFYSLFES